MTPLLDLRTVKVAPPGHQQELDFFPDAARHAYPEAFKREFYDLRKDIRVFGAGGAFEKVSQLTDLSAVALKVIDKQALGDAERAKLIANAQDIRFVFFFAVTAERLVYDFSYQFREDQELDVKRYSSRREMTVKLALWDSRTNKTVWIGTEKLAPTEEASYQVRNPTKQLKKNGNTFYWVGRPVRTSLAEERLRSPERFPAFPGREPRFSASFDDFALGLPIQPSEAKLIEYTHFTHHRPELAVRTAALGPHVAPSLQLGASSAINYNLRFGGAFVLPLGEVEVGLDGDDYRLASSAYGATFDYEWTLSPRVRLLTGVMAGAAVFTATPASPPPGTEAVSEADGALFLWPRVFCLFGDKVGFQWGVGGAARFFDGLEDPVVKAARPSAWSLDVSVAYAFKGF